MLSETTLTVWDLVSGHCLKFYLPQWQSTRHFLVRLGLRLPWHACDEAFLATIGTKPSLPLPNGVLVSNLPRLIPKLTRISTDILSYLSSPLTLSCEKVRLTLCPYLTLTDYRCNMLLCFSDNRFKFVSQLVSKLVNVSDALNHHAIDYFN